MKPLYWIGIVLAVVAGLVYVIFQEINRPPLPVDPPLTAEEMNLKRADLAFVEKGAKLYKLVCASCHGPLGGGFNGPNLTDDFWIHGKGTAADILSMVKKGEPMKGMPAWENLYRQRDLEAVTVYILTLKGTNPPDAKAPQGNRPAH